MVRRRLLALLVLASVLIPATAAASAVRAGQDLSGDAQYYRSAVLSVEPEVPGLTVTVSPSGDLVTLRNDSGRSVVVRGYSGEEYLRISSFGVEENTLSVTAALNSGAEPGGVPASDPSAAPVWTTTGTDQEASWPDQRVRWSAAERSPIVAADPASAHRVFEWAIPLDVDGVPTLVRGSVEWTGIPDAGRSWTWLIAGLAVLAALGALLLLRLRRQRARRTRRSSRRRLDSRRSSGAPEAPDDAPTLLDRRP